MDFLSLQASLRPDKEAVRDLTSGQSWSYKQWDLLVGQTVSWMQAKGLANGDRLVCIAKNHPMVVALSLACGRSGVIFVPLNWRLSKAELRSLLDDCTPAVVVGDDLAKGLNIDYVTVQEALTSASQCVQTKPSQTHYDEPSLILYTSGTTGRPKGIMHSEATIMETTLNMSLLGQVDHTSTFLCEAPMFHVIGLISCVRPALYNGGRIVLSDSFVPSRTLQRLSDSQLRVTHYFCVPQMACMLREQPDFNAGKLTLTALLTGGAPHPAVQIHKWLDDGIAIVDGYGMSEAGTVFGMPLQIPLIGRKAGCVGLPTHRIQVALLNARGEPVTEGEPGEICLKGANLFIGIWKQPDLYQRSFNAQGWFCTGDIAVKDADGYYRIVDRIKDMFISGGENVYPAEIEEVALQSAQVRECALVGVPDIQWGEVGCLYVVPCGSPDQFDDQQFQAEMAARLARYKQPKYIRLVHELPRTGAGKVRKNILKAQNIDDIQLV